ncbi:MAG TPA: S8 family peptidase [Polyangiaceae bacterium]|nr:S8 family peptidase [Polyangiaceae bacterium]
MTISVDRARHGNELKKQLQDVAAQLAARGQQALPAGVEAPRGFYLEFESPPGFKLEVESLEYLRSGIELIATRRTENRDWATVYVPEGKISFFVRRVERYLTENNLKSGTPKHRSVIESIANIRLAVAESFWTDDLDELPQPSVRSWWEVWLRGDHDETLSRFRSQAKVMGVTVGDRHLIFPERTVILAYGTLDQFAASLEFLDTLAELRKAGDVGSFFTRQKPTEQAAWARDLLARVKAPSEDAVAVCILDTGTNSGHMLLSPALAATDMHACKPQWGVADHDGHGTEMAGIALYGDLRAALVTSGPIELTHRLESVKILPPPPAQNRRDLYGAVTAEGIGYAELGAPERLRVIAMAITATETRDRGQPTSWSAAVDDLCAGVGDEERRLFFVSAGNLVEDAGLTFRSQNETESIHDPAQAWNAVTVGGFTDRVQIDEPSFAGWSCVAQRGDLAPTSTTSCLWQSQWPIKPEIVMEGGNMALSPSGKEADFTDSLSLISTYFRPQERQFTATGDTSAATAAAARVAALVRQHYPDLWPETVRALLVDSAEWTPRMKAEVANADGAEQVERLIRCFGYGSPDLERALWSASNAVALVVQDELQPFSGPKSNEMHLHQLPWPKAALTMLGAMEVELRVTLSYFVEPNPARRGWRKRHRYASHGLRFAVQKPTESLAKFRKRVNGAARDEQDTDAGTGDRDGWLINADLRGKGSLHHDRWTGTAADLATRSNIAIHPVIGWWRERVGLGRSESRARYALVVSIRTPPSTVDIYQPIEALVQVPQRIRV